jgi:hypothetical protein
MDISLPAGDVGAAIVGCSGVASGGGARRFETSDVAGSDTLCEHGADFAPPALTVTNPMRVILNTLETSDDDFLNRGSEEAGAATSPPDRPCRDTFTPRPGIRPIEARVGTPLLLTPRKRRGANISQVARGMQNLGEPTTGLFTNNDVRVQDEGRKHAHDAADGIPDFGFKPPPAVGGGGRRNVFVTDEDLQAAARGEVWEPAFGAVSHFQPGPGHAGRESRREGLTVLVVGTPSPDHSPSASGWGLFRPPDWSPDPDRPPHWPPEPEHSPDASAQSARAAAGGGGGSSIWDICGSDVVAAASADDVGLRTGDPFFTSGPPASNVGLCTGDSFHTRGPPAPDVSNLESADDGAKSRCSIAVETGEMLWSQGELLGQGAFGKVYAGLNQKTGELMAVKQLKFPSDDGYASGTGPGAREIAAMEREIAVCQKLRHRHIVGYLCAQRTRHNEMYVFLEYVPGGSIASMLRRFGVFHEDLCRHYTQQLLLGLEYLHG